MLWRSFASKVCPPCVNLMEWWHYCNKNFIYYFCLDTRSTIATFMNLSILTALLCHLPHVSWSCFHNIAPLRVYSITVWLSCFIALLCTKMLLCNTTKCNRFINPSRPTIDVSIRKLAKLSAPPCIPELMHGIATKLIAVMLKQLCTCWFGLLPRIITPCLSL